MANRFPPDVDGCDRCHNVSREPSMILMGKVFLARLCMDCRNDWDDFFRGRGLWEEIVECGIQEDMYMVMSQKDGIDRTQSMMKQFHKKIELDAEVFQIARAWISKDIA